MRWRPGSDLARLKKTAKTAGAADRGLGRVAGVSTIGCIDPDQPDKPAMIAETSGFMK